MSAATGFTPRLHGWCSLCGQRLDRDRPDLPMLNPDGSRHSHPDPWKVVDRMLADRLAAWCPVCGASFLDPCVSDECPTPEEHQA